MSVPDISAVIILYHPDEDYLKKAIAAIVDQVDKIILIDNSSDELATKFYDELSLNATNKISYIFNGENLGVAKAQNIGIKYSMDLGCKFVIIFDQDSLAEEDMVAKLKNDYLFLANRKVKVAAIGPQSINVQTQTAYKPRVKKHKPFFLDKPEILEVTELISSGCLIPAVVFNEVGYMDELLFIDGVDHEWCWRGATKGYKCVLTENARLHHMLGEGDRKFFFMTISVASPFRVYYQYRNFIYLSAKNYVPLYWKLNNLVKYIIKLFYYPMFVGPPKLYFKNMVRGINSGIKILLNK